MPENNLPETDHSELTDDELYELAVSATDGPDWSVVWLDGSGNNPVDVRAETRADAQLLADALNAGRLHGNPDQHHYVAVPTDRLNIIQ